MAGKNNINCGIKKETDCPMYGIINRMIGIQESSVAIHEKSADNAVLLVNSLGSILPKIVNNLKKLRRIVSCLLFVVGMLVWQVFLSGYTNILLKSIFKSWLSLSERTKSLFLSVIGLIIITVVSNIISFIFTEKIKDWFNLKKKN